MKELIEVQTKLRAPKSNYSSFGKYHYRSCEDILEALKPLLKDVKSTVSISDEVKEIGGIIFVESTATFTNEKENEVSVKAQAGINPNKKGFDIAQSFGSASSYARKYALNGLFLIDDTKDADHFDNSEDKKPLFTKAFAEGEALKGTDYKDLESKYIITKEQIAKYKHLTGKK